MIVMVPLDHVINNPWQTRHGNPNPAYIKELALSIAQNGLLQVPIARLIDAEGKPDPIHPAELDVPINNSDWVGYFAQLAFGHNRLAAYRWLNERGDDPNFAREDWSRIPLDLQPLSDVQMSVQAWTENKQRNDQTPLDDAYAIQDRIEAFGWTHEETAAYLGISRSAVSNSLRLIKLPGNIQESLGMGELSERSAFALIRLFDLPESIRKKGEDQYENSWDTRSAATKPSKIVKDALAGESSDRIRQRIDDLVGRFGEKLSSAPWKYSDNFTILMAGIDLPENISLAALSSPACKECSLRIDTHLCLDKTCFAVKTALWQISLLNLASQDSGIPYLDGGEANRYYRSVLDYGEARPHAEAIIATKCENLRLIYSSQKVERDDVDALDGHPFVKIICQKRSGSCSCLLGIQAQMRAKFEKPVSIPDAEEREDDQVPQGQTLVEIFDSEELRESARAARRERKASIERIPAIKEKVARILAGELLKLNAKLWKEIVYKVRYSSSKDLPAKGLTLEKLAEHLADGMAENLMPREDEYNGDPDPEGSFRSRVDRYLKEKGCPETGNIADPGNQMELEL